MKKNILIITQKVDINDPVLGFFHQWIVEFSKRVEHVYVICLEKGQYDLPKNVKVFSLGKEEGISKIKYTLNFYKYIWNLRKKYNSVFVHMNQEYVLLGGIFWRIFGKKVLMWRNHPQGSFLTKISVFLSNKVFCTSKDSFTNKFNKTKIMPVGIQIAGHPSDISRKENTILSLGRISPVKNIETIIYAFSKMLKNKKDLKLSIVGSPTKRDIDEDYYKVLKTISSGIPKESIDFIPGVAPDKTVDFYKSHDIFINTTTPGSFDKTILESMYFGSPCFVCQNIWEGTEFSYLSEHFYFPFNDSDMLAKKVLAFLSMPKEDKEKLILDASRFVSSYHGLSSLIDKIILEI